MRSIAAALIAVLAFVSAAAAADSSSTPALSPLEALYPDLEKLYIDLHQTPELSLHEEKTAAKP